MGSARWGRGMPILKICTSPGQLADRPLATIALCATMLFPKDEARQDQFYAIQAIDLIKQTETEPPAKNLWPVTQALSDAALEKSFPKQIENAQRSGETTGLLYRFFVQCMIHHRELASFNSALAMTACLIERYNKRRSEPRVRASSPSAITHCWSSHKCVAHLWTATKLDDENQDQPGWGDWRISDAGLLRMLAMSECLRTLGENHFARRQNIPALDPSQTWRVPDGLPLPEMTVAIVPPVESEFLIEIEKNRAARRT